MNGHVLGVQEFKVIPLILKPVKEPHLRFEVWQYLDFSNRVARPWGKLIDLLDVVLAGQNIKPKEIPPFVQKAVDALDSYELEDRKAANNQWCGIYD